MSNWNQKIIIFLDKTVLSKLLNQVFTDRQKGRLDTNSHEKKILKKYFKIS